MVGATGAGAACKSAWLTAKPASVTVWIFPMRPSVVRQLQRAAEVGAERGRQRVALVAADHRPLVRAPGDLAAAEVHAEEPGVAGLPARMAALDVLLVVGEAEGLAGGGVGL